MVVGGVGGGEGSPLCDVQQSMDVGMIRVDDVACAQRVVEGF
jgi:hypothetical protein